VRADDPASGFVLVSVSVGAVCRSIRSGLAQGHTVRLMSIELGHVVLAVGVGLGATLVMDLWTVFLKRTFNTPLPNYCFVGRWLRYMTEGVFRHGSIAAAPQKAGECTVGWIAHYATGVVYAFLLVLLASPQWLQTPTLVPAVGLGIATVAIPFFVMQPAFGLGAAASKTPNPAQSRLRSLMNHAAFGLGLYISALAIGFVVKACA